MALRLESVRQVLRTQALSSYHHVLMAAAGGVRHPGWGATPGMDSGA